MASTTTKEIVTEIPTLARVYSDGTVERFNKIKVVPPSVYVATNDNQKTGPAVSSKDVVISENPFIAARLYIQQKQRAEGDERLPILVYFHGGGFITESAFSPVYHGHINEFVSLVDVIVVSVEYRIAPEHYLPAAYQDCWAALNWVASHSSSTHSQRNSDIHGHKKEIGISTYNAICRLYDTPSYFKNLVENSSNSTESWLINYGDFNKVFVGGDSAGGNMTHHVTMRASSEGLQGGVKIAGAIISHVFFYGSDLDPPESLPEAWKGQNHYVSAWNWAYPNAPGGIDNPMMNPAGDGAPSLAGLGCEKVLVCVASKDRLRDSGVRYYEGVRKSGWKGKLELFEEEEEGHGYHIQKPQTVNSHRMIKRLGEFLLG